MGIETLHRPEDTAESDDTITSADDKRSGSFGAPFRGAEQAPLPLEAHRLPPIGTIFTREPLIRVEELPLRHAEKPSAEVDTENDDEEEPEEAPPVSALTRPTPGHKEQPVDLAPETPLVEQSELPEAAFSPIHEGAVAHMPEAALEGTDETEQPAEPPARPHIPPPTPPLFGRANSYDAPPPPPPSQSGTSGRTPPPPLPPINQPPHGGGEAFPPAGPGGPFSPNAAPYASAPEYSPISRTVEAATSLAAEALRPRTNVDPLARTLAVTAAVGSWIGHRRRRREIGRLDKQQKATTTQLRDLQTEQTRFAHEQRKQSHEMAFLQQAQQPNIAPSVSSTLAAERSAVTPTALPQVEARPPIPQEQAQEMQEHAIEHSEGHVVQDAWRRYEVDSRNREVVRPDRRGAAFYQEQREVMREPASGAGPQQGYSGMSMPQGQYTPLPPYPGGVPAGLSTPAGSQNNQLNGPKSQPMTAKDQKNSALPGPAFWIMLAVIITAFFVAALI